MSDGFGPSSIDRNSGSLLKSPFINSPQNNTIQSHSNYTWCSNELDYVVKALLDKLGHRGNEIHIGTNISLRLESRYHLKIKKYKSIQLTSPYGSTLEHGHCLMDQCHDTLTDGWI